jgi:hypothetical protein
MLDFAKLRHPAWTGVVMEKPASRGFHLSLKEVLVIVASTALALGSFGSNDPYVVIPMLIISGVAFVALCVGHQGSPRWRTTSAIFILIVLAFIGWRDLRKLTGAASHAAQPVSIDQKAVESECSNIVGGGDIKINCPSTEKDHAQAKP